MKKVELKNVAPYNAPKHFDMKAMKLHGEAEPGRRTDQCGRHPDGQGRPKQRGRR